MVILQHFGLRIPKMWHEERVPSQIQKVDVFPKIKEKIRKKGSNYSLNKKTAFVAQARAAGQFDLASSYIVVDYDTGDILFERNHTKKLPMASLTKIMTAVVALDLADPSDTFVVSKRAATITPTRIGIWEGDILTLEELLTGLLLTSGNDAAQTIKEGVDNKYNESVFIRAMNEKAAFLGLDNTHFSNPQGYDLRKHYSSAHDIAILTHYALTNYPLIADIVKRENAVIPAYSTHEVLYLPNWNGLLGVYPNVFGVKIGNTEKAGSVVVVGSEREGKRVLTVVLGTPGIIERDWWASQLLDLGFEKLGISPVNVTESQLRIKYRTWDYWYDYWRNKHS